LNSAYAKLNIVQTKLIAPKGQVNNFGKYKYRSNEDILSAVKPHLEGVKAVIVQSDEMKMIGDRFYVVATSKFIDCDTGDEVINTSYAREAMNKKGMDDAQITGATSSYARKYSLNGLLLIDDTKDADTMDNSHHNETPQVQQKPDKPWLNDIKELVNVARNSGWSADEAIKQARINYAVSKKVASEIQEALNN